MLLAPQEALAGSPPPSFQYRLASSTGVIPFSGASLSYDRSHDELYVLAGGQVQVFNEAGMEVYAFGASTDLGAVASVGVLEEGDIVALSFLEKGPTLVRCNFRGERIGTIELRGVPREHAGFVPNAMRYANGKIYLANLGQMTFLIVDVAGNFVAYHDVLPQLEGEEGKQLERQDLGIRGFNVDGKGRILFTIQPLFRAYVLTVAGQLRSWGVKGSAPGKFNVVGSIASDDQGNYYVADILKSAVIVFDRDFRFVREFGYRGPRPQDIVSPADIEAGGENIYVSQRGRRGVSVFKIERE